MARRHSAPTAAAIAGCSPERVTERAAPGRKADQLRKSIRPVSERTGARTAKRDYGVLLTREQAEAAQLAFFLCYPQLRAWQRSLVAQAMMTGCVRTPMGLVRDSSVSKSGISPVKRKTRRYKAAQVRCCYQHWRLPEELRGIDAYLYHHVHDEILLCVAADHAGAAANALSRAMVAGYLDVLPNGSVRNLVEVKQGGTWADVK
jgi:hypothetical protein